MARATVLRTTERKNLTTLPPTDDDPEGGWVELRRMSYGEKLEKDAEAMKMRLNMGPSSNGKQPDMNAEVAIVNVVSTILEFARCIVDHNLTTPIDEKDESKGDRPLNMRKAEDVRMLDPRVGQEISELIGDMNDFEGQSRTSEVDETGK